MKASSTDQFLQNVMIAQPSFTIWTSLWPTIMSVSAYDSQVDPSQSHISSILFTTDTLIKSLKYITKSQSDSSVSLSTCIFKPL